MKVTILNVERNVISATGLRQRDYSAWSVDVLVEDSPIAGNHSIFVPDAYNIEHYVKRELTALEDQKYKELKNQRRIEENLQLKGKVFEW